MVRPRMAAIDVDGTLVEPGDSISPENEAAVRRALAAGVHVVISTGRPYERITHIIEHLNLTDPVVTLGGALVMSASGEVYDARPIPPAAVRHIYGFCASRGLSVRAHVQGSTYAYFRSPNHPDIAANERLARHMPVHVDVSGDGSMMPVDGVYKVTIMFEDGAQAERLHAEIESEFARLHHAHSAARWLEFTARGVSKLRGVRYVARMLGASRRDVMAIGDNENDIEMIRWAGMGIYVDSAPTALKAYAGLNAPPGVSAVAWGLTQLIEGGIQATSPGRAAGASAGSGASAGHVARTGWTARPL